MLGAIKDVARAEVSSGQVVDAAHVECLDTGGDEAKHRGGEVNGVAWRHGAAHGGRVGGDERRRRRDRNWGWC